MIDPPVISVVIPAFNRASLLPEALTSVFAQAIERMEVIVVDDGSTDDTQVVLQSYADRIRVIQQPNGGPSAARNTGIQAASGQWVALLDSDDLWLPGKLKNDLDHFRRFPEADVVISDATKSIEGELKFDSWLENRRVHLKPGNPEFISAFPPIWIKKRLFSSSAITIRRGALGRLGPRPYDEAFRSGEDRDFEVRMLLKCNVLVVPEVWVHARCFDDGTRFDRPIPGTGKSPQQRKDQLGKRIKIFNKILNLEPWPEDVAIQIQNKIMDMQNDLNELELQGY